MSYQRALGVDPAERAKEASFAGGNEPPSAVAGESQSISVVDYEHHEVDIQKVSTQKSDKDYWWKQYS